MTEMLTVPTLTLERPLLPAERRVLQRLARGEKYADICRAEYMSRGALCNLVKELFALLGATLSSEAVARGHEAGVLLRDRYPRPDLTPDQLLLLRSMARSVPVRVVAEAVGERRSALNWQKRVLYRDMGAVNQPNAVHIAYCTEILGAVGCDAS